MSKQSLTRLALACAAAGALSATPAVASTAHQAAARPTVLTTHHTKMGTVISNVAGHSVYIFTGRSCTGRCTRTWIPLMATGKLEVARSSGLNPRLMGRVRRGRAFQLTYKHHALYLFSRDRKAGEVQGEGEQQFGGYWYLLDRSGNELFVLAPTY